MSESVYQNRDYFGKNNPKWRGGLPKCLDCGVFISYGKMRCQPCYHKSVIGTHRSTWKGEKPKCLDCGKQLSAHKAIRCYSCAGKERSGPNSGAWKGGVTAISRGERRGVEVTRWRKAVLKRDGYKCQLCGSGENLQVHHIKEWKHYKELRTEVDNGVTLCGDCHLYGVHQGNLHYPPLNFWDVKAKTVPLIRIKLCHS